MVSYQSKSSLGTIGLLAFIPKSVCPDRLPIHYWVIYYVQACLVDLGLNAFEGLIFLGKPIIKTSYNRSVHPLSTSIHSSFSNTFMFSDIPLKCKPIPV